MSNIEKEVEFSEQSKKTINQLYRNSYMYNYHGNGQQCLLLAQTHVATKAYIYK